jgi:hypothetical protein
MARYAKGKYGIAARERKERKKTNHRLTQIGPGGGRRERSRNSREKAQNAQKEDEKISRKAAKAQRFGGPKGVGPEADER